MTGRIGVRDLKNKASEIVQEVHEHDAEYIVTLRGEPVAILRPFPEKNERDMLRAQTQDALTKLDTLAEEITRAWRSEKGAVELEMELVTLDRQQLERGAEVVTTQRPE